MIYVNAKWQITPTPGTRTYDLVVLHDVEGPEVFTLAENVANYFATTDRKASTHYVVDADSEVQCVPEEMICYGAGGANRNGIHIEHAGYASQTRDEWLDDYGRAMLERSAALTRDICARHDIPLVFLDAAALLPTSTPRGITTHAEVDKAYRPPDPHWDPGPGFPIDYYMALVSPPQKETMPELLIQSPKIGEALLAVYHSGAVRHIGGDEATYLLNVAKLPLVTERDRAGYLRAVKASGTEWTPVP